MMKRVNVTHEWAHRGLINSYQLLITAARTNKGSKMKGVHSRVADDRCPFVPRDSLCQVTSFMQLGMLWYMNFSADNSKYRLNSSLPTGCGRFYWHFHGVWSLIHKFIYRYPKKIEICYPFNWDVVNFKLWNITISFGSCEKLWILFKSHLDTI